MTYHLFYVNTNNLHLLLPIMRHTEFILILKDITLKTVLLKTVWSIFYII